MIRLVGYLAAALSFLLLQTNLLPALLPNYLKPELLLILVVYLCMVEGFVRGAVIAWGIGLLLDACGGHLIGLHAASYLIIFILGRWSVGTLNTESPLLILILVFCASLLNLLVLVGLGIFADLREMFILFGQRAMFQASVNVIAVYLLMVAIARLQRRFGSRLTIPGLDHLSEERYGA